MTGDFNIRDSNWDPNFHHHSIHTDNLITITNSLGLELSPSSNPGPTRYTNNLCDTNSVLDLVFLLSNNARFGQHSLYPEIQKLLDHIPLVIEVGIKETSINISIQSIKKDSKEEKSFIELLIHSVENLNVSSTRSREDLQNSV